VTTHTMQARLTHLAVLTALAVSAVLGKLGWLGFGDGAW
jgi:hypothetical protein